MHEQRAAVAKVAADREDSDVFCERGSAIVVPLVDVDTRILARMSRRGSGFLLPATIHDDLQINSS